MKAFFYIEDEVEQKGDEFHSRDYLPGPAPRLDAQSSRFTA